MYEILLSTSEFAKIVGVSKHTLFHYDKEGVFCPEKKDERGFRSYSVFQIETFFVIQSLAEMGVTLSKIKVYLQTRSGENCLHLLEKHERILTEKIEKLKKTKALIKEKKETIKAYFACKTKGVHIAFEPEERLFITPSNEEDYYTHFIDHVKKASKHTLNLPSAVGHMIKNENIEQKTFFDFYFSKTEKANASSFIKPAGRYVTYYHDSGYFTIDKAYEKILAYGKENQINLGEYFFEFMVLDELAVEGIENFVIKISIAVKA